MNNVRYTTASYTKLFLLMIIPIYGLCFTVLLAFSKDIEEELKCLARGALIARVIFLIALGITITIFISYIRADSFHFPIMLSILLYKAW